MVGRGVHPRTGFTLIEILVVLASGGLVMLGSRLLIEQLATTASTIHEVQEQADASAARDVQLRLLLLRTDADSVDGARFTGDATHAQFASWCDVPRGWQERCQVALTVVSDGRTGGIQVSTTSGFREVVAESLSRQFRYLGHSDHGVGWVDSWNASLVPPIALGLVSATDTVMLRIGARR